MIETDSIRPNLIVFGFGTLFGEKKEIFAQSAEIIMGRQDLLKMFIVSSDDPGFSMEHAIKLASGGVFRAYGISNPEPKDNRQVILGDLVRSLGYRNHLNRVFLFTFSQEELVGGRNLRLNSLMVSERFGYSQKNIPV